MVLGSRLLSRAAILTACLSFLAMVLAAPVSAQTSQAPVPAAPPEKVEQLMKLLDDPEVKSWLATKSVPAGESREQAAAAEIASWEDAIRHHLLGLRGAVPLLPGDAANAVQTLRTEINGHGFATIILLFGALLALGFGAEWLFRRAIAARRDTGSHEEARSGAFRLLSELMPVAVFSIVSAGAFLVFQWPALLRVIILTYLVAFIVVRAVIAIARTVLAPEPTVASGEGAPRMIATGDAAARFWYRRLVIFIGYLMAGWATVSLLPRLKFPYYDVALIAYVLGAGLLALAIEIVWRRPRSDTSSEPSVVVNWLLTGYLVVLWGLWIAGMNGALWVGIYALVLPRAMSIAGQVAQALAATEEDPHAVRTVLIVRGARALVVVAAVLWLSRMLQLNPGTLAQDNAVASQIMRGVLRGVVILLGADLLWHLAKAYINRSLEVASGSDPVGAAEAARRGRMRTLLPIFRNALAVLIAVVAVLMVLSEFGVQIGPLIAGAGIFGVAIGFGSQTLVKDIMSGIFYMLDDAFRVGEYIQSGSYKGTVESFSLRSVRLRHHRGPVFTVPFGELGAVQNMSRDWVIEKMTIGVTYDSDIDLARKLIKKVGQELAQEPEFAEGTIAPLKMQGIDSFGDFAIVLRMKLMTKPGAQYGIKRKALMLIKKAFDENGIKIATPTVQVSGGDEAAAAAGETLRKRQAAKAAAPAA
ncbi:mechanosensitive ion channel protein MscS [Mesorhizobium sp. L-8-10]|nr:mechanosensitive ion channel protein MscS [Mesorhizobium sp. L-8-10]